MKGQIQKVETEGEEEDAGGRQDPGDLCDQRSNSV
jgi:hypothetical protein